MVKIGCPVLVLALIALGSLVPTSEVSFNTSLQIEPMIFLTFVFSDL